MEGDNTDWKFVSFKAVSTYHDTHSIMSATDDDHSESARPTERPAGDVVDRVLEHTLKQSS